MALTDAERVFVEALRTVRASLMDTITGLDDTIAEIEQAAEARIDPAGGISVREHPPQCPVCRSPLKRRQINVSAVGDEPKQFLDGPWFCPKGHDI